MKSFEDIEQYLDEIYSLKHIIRYNNIPKIVQESVAEHSFFVTSIVLKLYEEYEFDIEKALIMAITHDYVEIFISDVPRNVKNKYPLLRDTLKTVEQQAWIDLFPQFAKYNQEFEEKKSRESLIVKLADSLSIVQYSLVEVKLGNIDYMKKVNDGLMLNIDDMLTEVEDIKRIK